MILEFISWAGMVLIALAVIEFSDGRARSGNWFNVFGTSCWMIMAMSAGLAPLFVLNGSLFVRSAWMLHKRG